MPFKSDLKKWLKNAQGERDKSAAIIDRAVAVLKIEPSKDVIEQCHNYDTIMWWPSNYQLLSQYLDKMEKEAKEQAERAKIEAIIMDLVKKSALKE